MAEQNKLYNDDDRSLNVLFGLKLSLNLYFYQFH